MGIRLDPNSPTVPLNHLFADRKTDTRSGIFCFAVQALKDHEDTLGKLSFNANAVVIKREEPLIPDYTAET